MLDQLVVLRGSERQLRRSAIRIQDAEDRLLVADHGGAVVSAFDPYPRPRVQLVGDVIYDCIGAGHPSIVPLHAGNLQPWPPPTSTARSPRSSAPTTRAGSPTRGSRSSRCTVRRTSPTSSLSASANRGSIRIRAASTP